MRGQAKPGILPVPVFLLAADSSTGVVPTTLPGAGPTVLGDPNRTKDAFISPRS